MPHIGLFVWQISLKSLEKYNNHAKRGTQNCMLFEMLQEFGSRLVFEGRQDGVVTKEFVALVRSLL
jgi:hypothetical protein